MMMATCCGGRSTSPPVAASSVVLLTCGSGAPARSCPSVARLGASPLAEPIIALNASGVGLVNNVCVLSDVAPSYAPPGRALISVSVLGLHPDAELPDRVKEELGAWFGAQVEEWIHLRTDLIKHALPEQLPEPGGPKKEAFLKMGDVWICGDHTSSASIEGAIISGTQSAEMILAEGAPHP